ncbi:MAG TPA: prolipoprotein diacylglyceryl transferase [Candidatus Binatia bacterium]|nr:prolipoprotein diacylglyceryl transferase [Candidatus Binatia bacterium]
MVFINSLEPALFSIGPFSLRWYGLLYALGVFFVYWYARNEITQGRFRTTLDKFDTGFFWIVVAMVLGARLFEVLFYNPGYYFANPVKILFIWEGGLSFHGGLLGAMFAAWLWCRREKVPFLHLADILIVPAALAQAFGRLGNFFNQELVGKPWNGPWAFIYTKVDEVPRHPVQLYEILYNVIIFIILWTQRKKGLPTGSLFALFLLLYGAFRFVTEFFKVPEVFFAGLALGQWLSIVMVVVGVWLWFKVRRAPVPI